ncbi:MAG: adenosylcobinamide-GDP ribazoletransferase [Actinomycetales bacterium]
MRTARNGIALAVGTLTRIPVRPPDRVDRQVAGFAMSFAPVVGLLLAVLIGVPMAGLAWALGASDSPLACTLIAVLAIAGLAWLTRGLHLDGLADLADALGSGRPAEQALAIARRSDIGPFGTSAMLLALLLQVAALGLLIADGFGIPALAATLIASRLGLTWACTPNWPPARADGLGATVAQSTSTLTAGLVTGVLLGLSVVSGWYLDASSDAIGLSTLTMPFAVIAALGAAWTVCRIATRRLGGITGDVLGGCVEWAMTCGLVAAALLGSEGPFTVGA